MKKDEEMRIHSRFKDYYDTALGHGVDTTLHYNRTERDFAYTGLTSKLPEDLTEAVRWIRKPFRHARAISIDPKLIGFCGRIYPLAILQDVSKGVFGRKWGVFSRDEYDATRRLNGLRSQYRGEETVERFFAGHQNDSLFIETNAPVFVIGYEDEHASGLTLTTNPFLRAFEFYRCVDAFTAFQEISMYLGNTLTTRERTVDVADKYRVAQHGFDKWSFRRPPMR